MHPGRPGAGKADLITPHPAQVRGLGGVKGVHILGVSFGGAAGSVDLTMHHDHHPPATRPGMGGNSSSIQDVARAIGVRVGSGPLRPGEDNRGIRGDRHVEEKGGLFHRIGAVQDEDAAHAAGQFPHPSRQLEPDGRPHALAGDIGKLLHADPSRRSYPFQPRHGRHQVHPGNGRDRSAGDRVHPHRYRPPRSDDLQMRY